MRARTALRVVALVSTLAGSAALPLPAAAATTTTKKSSSKTTKKSTSKSTSSKSTGSKSASSKSKTPATASKSATAPAPAAKSSTPSSSKAAFDPLAASPSIPGAPATAAAAGAPAPRGPTRIDFDDRLIQGQTNKSGAVYLYDRKELKQSSMVKKRESFREEIVGVVYDSEL
jgi:cytoskeletal protein RodZ